MTSPTHPALPGLTAMLQSSDAPVRSQLGVHELAAADEFFAAVLDALRRIKLGDGKGVTVEAKETDYVVPGHEFRVLSSDSSIAFWVGLNGHRLHFITTLDVDETEAEQSTDLDTPERQMDGWRFLFLPAHIDLGMRGAIVKGRVLMASTVVGADGKLTESGLAWAIEVAHLAQDLVRDCECNDFGEHPVLVPAPHN